MGICPIFENGLDTKSCGYKVLQRKYTVLCKDLARALELGKLCRHRFGGDSVLWGKGCSRSGGGRRLRYVFVDGAGGMGNNLL